MTLGKVIKDQGCFLILSGGFLILGSIASYCFPLGAVWYECLENGKMLISGIAPACPAYPMWGYCFLVALMGRAVIILQASLAFVFILLCYLRCRSLAFGTPKTYPSLTDQLVLGILLIPWFFLVTTSLTKSMASLFICLGTCCLYKGATNKSLPLLVLAGSSLGLGYNFRGEVIILGCFYFVALLVHVFRTDPNIGSRVKYLVSFATAVTIFTIPWLVYTKLTLGHSRLSSTNSGAVKYEGLGILPNNPWGIIPNDPYVWKIALDHNMETPWGFEADQLFTNRFAEAVKSHPISFLHRILRGWFLMFMRGLYVPDFGQLFLVDPGNHILEFKKEYIPYDNANEKLKEILHLKNIDDPRLKRYQSDEVGFHEVQFKHWLTVLGQYSVRGFFALVFLWVVVALLSRVIRSRSPDLSLTLPLACLGYELFIGGFIQTLPSHTTQIWPVLVMFQYIGPKRRWSRRY